MSQINLLPASYKPKKQVRLLVVIVLVAIICGAGFLGWQTYLAKTEISSLQHKLYMLENRIEDLKYLKEKQAEIAELKSSVEALKTDYQKGKMPESKIIAIVEHLLPPEVYIDGISITSDGIVSCGVTADSYETVAQMIIKLNSYSIIEDVQMSGVSKNSADDDNSSIDMSAFTDYFNTFNTSTFLDDFSTDTVNTEGFTFSLSFRIVWEGHSEEGDTQ